jgi:NADH-quinone oxidoreductase subunit A
MADSALPIVMTLVLACTIAGAMIVASHFLGRPKKSRTDISPYECGMPPYERTVRHRFSVRFYLIAMLFILFDIEVAFMVPWAVTFQGFADDQMFVLIEMTVFLGILVAGFAYLWLRGALEWE